MAELLKGAEIVVGLDIGTACSCFAFAHKRKPKAIYTFYDWPRAGGNEKPSPKTLSAIYYGPGDATTAQVRLWGYPARVEYARDLLTIKKLQERSVADMPEFGTYFEDFKCHLASNLGAGESSDAKHPKGFTVTQVIADYLREMGAYIMQQVANCLAIDFTMDEVQWCVTVPSNCGDHAQKLVEVCMERAGLIRSAISPRGSPHPLSVVLDLEAASCHCLRNFPDLNMKVGDKLLVANISNEGSDIVVQEVVSVGQFSHRIKEVATSFGVCEGEMYLDEQFEKLMLAKIPCLDRYLVQSCATMRNTFKYTLEYIKCAFGDASIIRESVDVLVPAKLSAWWEEYDKEHGNSLLSYYDELVLTYAEIETVFKPLLDQIVGSITDQLLTSPIVKAIAVVGECSGSPYLLSKIKERLGFLQKVVISPPNAASSICKGAVMLALDQVCITHHDQADELDVKADPGKPEVRNLEEGMNALNRCAQLSEYGPASSSCADGTTVATRSSQEFSELSVPAHGSTSPHVWSSSTSGGASEPSPTVYKTSDSIAEDVVKKYSWDQVLHLTNNLTSRPLGRGSFGTVYLGKLENGKEVALKVLDPSSQQGMPEFLNEVNLLKRVNHVNLVRLFGYCQDEQQVLVYEFAEEGSIWDHLHGERTRLNDWRLRLSIALQAACGLEYLHTLCSPRIIHRDIKSENILLSKTMVAKVADFGLSRLGAEEDNINEKTHFTTKVIGTRGYLDPEYHLTGKLRHSSDVYSFGIVLLEIITGRKPVPNSDPKCCIGNWVEGTYGSGGGRVVKEVADSAFGGRYNPEAMKLVIKLALSCIKPSGESRPKMSDVVRVLREAQTLELAERKSCFPCL